MKQKIAKKGTKWQIVEKVVKYGNSWHKFGVKIAKVGRF
jgi:hypothetical protein